MRWACGFDASLCNRPQAMGVFEIHTYQKAVHQMLHLVCFCTISSAFDYTVTGHEAGDRLKPLNSILQIWTTFRIGGHSICSYAPQTLSNLISFLGYLLKCLIEVWLFRRDELDCVSSRQLWKQQQKLFAFGSTWFKTRTSRMLPGKQVWFVFPFTYFLMFFQRCLDQ